MRNIFLLDRFRDWGFHSLYNYMIHYPPNDYRYLYYKSKNNVGNVFKNKLYKWNYYMHKNNYLKVIYDYTRPVVYVVYTMLKDINVESNIDIIFSSQHVISTDIPWVVDLEHAGALAAYGKIFPVRNILEKYLESESCKSIITWTKMGKRSLLSNLDCSKFQNKITEVPLAVPLKNNKKIVKKEDDIRILFVGTSNPLNINNSFNMKGGRELFLIYDKIKEVRNNVKLTVRTNVPIDYKIKYHNDKNVNIIDEVLSYPAISKIFEESDIFLFPGHSTPGLVFLDAMNNELPIVTTDVWANKEIIFDNINGFICPSSKNVTYHNKRFIPQWANPNFMKQIKTYDEKSINSLVEKTLLLIDDINLRKKLGKQGRKFIETGKFSIPHRNHILKNIFDNAM